MSSSIVLAEWNSSCATRTDVATRFLTILEDPQLFSWAILHNFSLATVEVQMTPRLYHFKAVSWPRDIDLVLNGQPDLQVARTTTSPTGSQSYKATSGSACGSSAGWEVTTNYHRFGCSNSQPENIYVWPIVRSMNFAKSISGTFSTRAPTGSSKKDPFFDTKFWNVQMYLIFQVHTRSKPSKWRIEKTFLSWITVDGSTAIYLVRHVAKRKFSLKYSVHFLQGFTAGSRGESKKFTGP